MSRKIINRSDHSFLINLTLAIIYLFINLLFVWKYFAGSFTPLWLSPVLYTIITVILIFIPLDKIKISLPSYNLPTFYFSLVAISTIILLYLMSQFDPNLLDVSRYPALHDWLSRLLAGEYPYWPGGYPSGFPFLFILALPFYLLGNLGLIQIAAFVTFAIIVYLHNHPDPIEKFRVILLLLAAPIFLYEVVVRSELFSNMVAIMLYLVIFEKYCESGKKSLVPTALLGIIGGGLLATRGIVLVIYIVFLLYLLLKYKYRYLVFSISTIAGFAITIIPFVIWNYDYFNTYGPLTIQMWYIPVWFLALIVIASIACGSLVKTIGGAYYAITFILFGAVLYPFMEQVFIHGFNETLMGNFFDISYFAFALPFLLLSFKRKGTAN